MEDKNLGIILLVIMILLLGFSFYANVSDLFNYLADPNVGEGFGFVCKSKEECVDFCQNNMGRCRIYCAENPSNVLCGQMFGAENES